MDPRIPQLLEQISQVHPADAQEAAHQSQMITVLQRGGRPLDRDHWQPGHFTASSFVLSPDNQKLLLIFHGKLLRWLQPGGHIDAGDSDAVAAARREVGEETAIAAPTLLLALPFDLDVHAIPARKGDPEHLHLDIRYLWRAPSWSIAAGDDAQQARWVEFAEVEALESDESVRRAVRKIAALHGQFPGAVQT